MLKFKKRKKKENKPFVNALRCLPSHPWKSPLLTETDKTPKPPRSPSIGNSQPLSLVLFSISL